MVSPAGGYLDLRRLGSDYGGWWIPINLIGENSICYCAGVGLDATFDVALADELSCCVFSFDPTPFSIAYTATVESPRISFYPWGVWCRDEKMTFFSPSWSDRESLSVYDLHYGQESFIAPCFRISTIMQRLGHDRLDLLKLDIEGAWGDVLDDMLDSGIRPTILCVEFDSPAPPQRVLRLVQRLKSERYRLVKTERDNTLFVRR